MRNQNQTDVTSIINPKALETYIDQRIDHRVAKALENATIQTGKIRTVREGAPTNGAVVATTAPQKVAVKTAPKKRRCRVPKCNSWAVGGPRARWTCESHHGLSKDKLEEMITSA